VIYSGTPRNLARLAKVLREGCLVAVPTETVYGLAANAYDARACRRIFAVKGRPKADPLIVHVRGWSDLADIAVTNDAARALARRFWPGPLTLVLDKLPSIPDEVTAGRPSVAVRAPAHPLLRRLLALTGRPLAAPSANPFGYVSPTTADHVRRGLGNKVPHILDGGPSSIGLESTIVDVRDPRSPRLLRPGKITRAQIEKVLGVRLLAPPKPSRLRGHGESQVAPGQFERHYSPRTPVVLHARLDPRQAARGAPDEVWLFLARPAAARASNIFWLDARGSLAGAARRLFATLRRLDEGRFRKIHVEMAPGAGLADAINDRLRRAAAR
jgi:L-threonylcarbamoyladenylate synthase